MRGLRNAHARDGHCFLRVTPDVMWLRVPNVTVIAVHGCMYIGICQEGGLIVWWLGLLRISLGFALSEKIFFHSSTCSFWLF